MLILLHWAINCCWCICHIILPFIANISDKINCCIVISLFPQLYGVWYIMKCHCSWCFCCTWWIRVKSENFQRMLKGLWESNLYCITSDIWYAKHDLIYPYDQSAWMVLDNMVFYNEKRSNLLWNFLKLFLTQKNEKKTSVGIWCVVFATCILH